MYFITPDSSAVDRALEAWQWIGLENKSPILITVFADVFFQAPDGIWFLDSSLEGDLKKVCEDRQALERMLSSEDARDEYLLAAFVERAIRESVTLREGECYDFRIHPRIGGRIAFENIEKRDFLVALNLRGQLHGQVRHLPAGTKISKFVIRE